MRLLATHLLTIDNPIGTANLLALVNAQDPRIMGSYSLFREDGDKNDLIDTLFRLSRVPDANKANSNIEAFSTGTTKPPASAPAATTTKFPVPAAEARAAYLTPTLTVDEQGQIIDILVKANALTDKQAEYCKKNLDDDTLKTIFVVYERSKDVHAMIGHLQIFSSSAADDKDGNDDQEEDDEEDEEEEEEDDEDDDDDDEDARETANSRPNALNREDRLTVQERFVSIVQNLEMTQMETAALRLAIARQDRSVMVALENFKQDLSENNLVNSLKNIAKQVIIESLQSNDIAGSSDTNNEDTEAVRRLPNYTDDDEDDDDDDSDDDDSDDDDDDEDDDEDQSPVSNDDRVKVLTSARNHIFPLLVSELAKANIISLTEGKNLLKLFQEQNSSIHSALDTYDRDSDLHKLVVSMKETVKYQ